MIDSDAESEYFVDKPMNIYSEAGTRVRYSFSENGSDGDKKLALEHLVPGELYTVKRTLVDNFYTSVELEEFPGVRFNTVMFADARVF